MRITCLKKNIWLPPQATVTLTNRQRPRHGTQAVASLQLGTATRTLRINIDARVLELQCSISALLAEKTLVQDRLNDYTYPVLTLPNEMVAEIFIRFVQSHPPFIGLSSPTSLTHVCRKWREVALVTPALWSVICLGETNSHISCKRQGQISDIWSSWSCSLPLSIHVSYKGRSNAVPGMLSGVIPHRARWESLTLCVLPSILPMIDGPMPLLRHLALLIRENTTDIFAFNAVPQLRSVVLNGFESQVTLPWAQLTSLTLNFFRPGHCVQILQQTVNLIHCVLRVISSPEIDEYGYPGFDITLSRLESLDVLTLDEATATGFLHTFIVPVLRTLRVEERCLGVKPVDYLTSFISKSRCGLCKLALIGDRSHHSSSYIRAFPSISEISLNGLPLREAEDTGDSGSEDEEEDSQESNSSDVQTNSDLD
ncbi:hypothetical protein K438DRAFT_2079109 [Mycena galopus ATCC 62051]|nr:hypothetical protein K438DRAFT_2079109 [Mycena galopus ATCC 62051]